MPGGVPGGVPAEQNARRGAGHDPCRVRKEPQHTDTQARQEGPQGCR